MWNETIVAKICTIRAIKLDSFWLLLKYWVFLRRCADTSSTIYRNFMDYNSNRKRLILPEYGRNIQSIVDQVVAIEDREERNAAAKRTIEIMGNLFPYLRDVPDFKHKLWDHIAIMSDFKLDIDGPYPALKKEELVSKPKTVKYPKSRVKIRHYGLVIEGMAKKAAEMEDDDLRDKLIEMLANQMKKSYLMWNGGSIDNDTIMKDISRLAGVTVKPKGEIKIAESKDILLKMRKPRQSPADNQNPRKTNNPRSYSDNNNNRKGSNFRSPRQN